MTHERRSNQIDLDQLAREAELRWRVHALNRHVLGEPDASRPNPALIALWLGLLCFLALVLWAGLFTDPLSGTDLAEPDKRTAAPLLGLAFLVKLAGAALLALCLLHRRWLLAMLNITLVTVYLITSAMGVFELQGPESIDTAPPKPAEGLDR